MKLFDDLFKSSFLISKNLPFIRPWIDSWCWWWLAISEVDEYEAEGLSCMQGDTVGGGELLSQDGELLVELLLTMEEAAAAKSDPDPLPKPLTGEYFISVVARRYSH